MKTTIALSLATLIGAATFIQAAAIAPSVARHSGKSEPSYAGRYAPRVDHPQSDPFHRGPIYNGYPLSDWYVY